MPAPSMTAIDSRLVQAVSASTRVMADAAHTNRGYIRVMEEAGLRRAGSDGQLVYYEL